MNIFRRPSSSRASSESTSASTSASPTVSPSTSRSASLTRYSSDASYFGPRSTRVQHDIVGSFVIREIYNTKPNGWYLRVQLVSGGSKDRKGKGKARGKDNGSTQFSIPITKKARGSAGVQWDLSKVFDVDFPDWRDNEKTRRKLVQEYHLASLSYYEYAAKRPGGTPPRQVCQFDMERQIKQQQYGLLRRLLNNAAFFR